MPKVLFVGSYRDGTGWAQASIDYIHALNTVGVDLVIRPLKLNNHQGEIDQTLTDLEQKSATGADVIIQHTLPHFMEYKPGVKNIGLFVTETDSCFFTNWVRKLNIMDEVWVANTSMLKLCEDNGVKKPVRVIPHATNVEKYKRDYPEFKLPTDGKFTFYFIGELVRRKNIGALLKAFHTEFSFNEPVSLVLKVNKPGISQDAVYSELSKMCETNKRGLRLYKDVDRYHKEIIIPGYLTEEEIHGVHRACDCFVMPSFGEAWNIPAFDAIGHGNTPICTDVGGMKDFADKVGILVPGTIEPVAGVDEVVPRLHTGHETWVNIDVMKLRKAMRYVYKFHDHDMFKANFLINCNIVQKHSYENIGEIMKESFNVT